MTWDSSDDYATSVYRAWFDAWLHRGLLLRNLEPSEAYTVATLLQSRLSNIGFLKESQLRVEKG